MITRWEEISTRKPDLHVSLTRLDQRPWCKAPRVIASELPVENKQIASPPALDGYISTSDVHFSCTATNCSFLHTFSRHLCTASPPHKLSHNTILSNRTVKNGFIVPKNPNRHKSHSRRRRFRRPNNSNRMPPARPLRAHLRILPHPQVARRHNLLRRQRRADLCSLVRRCHCSQTALIVH